MLVVTRYRVDPTDAAVFTDRLAAALTALSERPGHLRGRAGPTTDDPGLWVMVTEWESVGAYRRALGGYDVKVHATPLLAQALDEPGAVEVVLDHDGTQLHRSTSDRAQ